MKTGRNDPCPCGSGKKYKKCCLNNVEPVTDFLWRKLGDIHDRLINKLLDFGNRKFGEFSMVEAMDEFMLWPDDEAHDKLIQDHIMLFMPWFLYNWVYDPDEVEVELKAPPFQTIAEAYAMQKDRQLSDLEKKFIFSTVNQPYSFYEVIQSNPGEGFTLKDIFQGNENEVLERKGSEGTKSGDILFCRLIKVDHVSMIVGCSSILIPPRYKIQILELKYEMLSVYRQITSKVLSEYDFEIRELYFEIFESLHLPPQLNNTDGDPIVFHTLHYKIDDPDTAFNLLGDLCVTDALLDLRSRATLDKNAKVAKVEFPWTRKGHKTMKSLENTVLGHIIINKTKLIVEVNSDSRAVQIRKEIESRLGSHARYVTTTVQSTDAMMEKARNDGKKNKTNHDELMQLPEIREELKALTKNHWDNWVNQKIPALGGITPKKAAKTPEGRESVEALLQDAERRAADDIHMESDILSAINAVRKKLKMDNPLKLEKQDNKKIEKRVAEIKNLISEFGRERLDTLHTGFSLNLCDRITNLRELHIERGRIEIWAASIVYTIARMNFLFDPESKVHITADTISDFFGTVKSTIACKATFIEQACVLTCTNNNFCRQDIIDAFTFAETSEGFIMPQNMLANTPNISKSTLKNEHKAKEGRGKKKPADDKRLNLFDE